ncbi:MAG: hypothetical protein WCG45_01165 [bacterium]
MKNLKNIFPCFFEKESTGKKVPAKPELSEKQKKAIEMAKENKEFIVKSAKYFNGTEDGNLDIKSSTFWKN